LLKLNKHSVNLITFIKLKLQLCNFIKFSIYFLNFLKFFAFYLNLTKIPIDPCECYSKIFRGILQGKRSPLARIKSLIILNIIRDIKNLSKPSSTKCNLNLLLAFSKYQSKSKRRRSYLPLSLSKSSFYSLRSNKIESK